MENGLPPGSSHGDCEINRQHGPNVNTAVPPPGWTSSHKRHGSGGIFAKLPFIRTSLDESSLPRSHDVPTEPVEDITSPKKGGAMANAMRQSKTRKRKGSLRKTALLGRGRRNSALDIQKRAPDPPASPTSDLNVMTSPTSPDDELTPRRFSYESPSAASSSDSGWQSPSTHQPLTLQINSTTTLSPSNTTTPPLSPSPARPALTSPVINPYASTTSDDDTGVVPFPHNSTSQPTPYYPHGTLAPATTPLLRRRSTKSHPHPLPLQSDQESEWDYSETEWWGWVVLVVTWLVFVVGMGSCLGVWSWAWDVGETPYAPPELEDDPTLPIVGYYPVLIVMTAVMAWVWVVVAWVGMKYFRHAKVVGEEN